MKIRTATQADRKRIVAMIEAFSPLDAELAKRDLEGETFVAVEGRTILGVTGIIPDQLSPRVCWSGWTYFNPEKYHRGPEGPGDFFGALTLWSRLHSHIEQVAARRGKLLFVSTSTHPAYAPALAFYRWRGYRIAGTLPDFYAEGVDFVALCRRPRSTSEILLHETDGQEGKIRLMQGVLDAFADLFREYEVIAPGMAPNECTQSLRRHLEDARKYRALNLAQPFSRLPR